MLAIKNVTVVMPDHMIPDGVIITDGGKIVDAGRKLNIPPGAKVIDGEGNYAGPGLVDIHTHGDGDRYFYDDPHTVSDTLLRHGVTSVLPALYFNLNRDEYIAAMDIIEKAAENGEFPNFAGYYMEGPYLNPKFGCNKETNPWRGAINKKDYAPVVDRAAEKARVWCVAPERENIEEFVSYAKMKNCGAVFSVAHSEATPDEIERLMPYGLRLGTHHTNATGTLESFPECRGVCVDEAVQYNDEIYAELICDFLGIHVHPYLLRLIAKIKGKDKIILISDAFVADGPPIPGCEEAFDINFDHSGEIAGSRMTLDIACRNMMLHTGCSLCDVFKYASLNPSKLLSMHSKGVIKKGNDADIVIVDHKFNVLKTIIKGEEYYAD